MRQKIRDAQDAISILNGSMRDLLDEQLAVITLNRANKVIAIHNEVTKGSDTATIISSKQIARIAVIDYASSVILIHNHPSGDVRPSKEDIAQTSKVKKALELLDICLLDHIIVGDESYYSFCDEKTYMY